MHIFRNKKRNNRFQYKPRSFSRNLRLRSSKGKKDITFIKKLILPVFLALPLYFLFISDFFRINEIRVQGNKNISADEIKIIANSEITKAFMGVFPMNNYFTSREDAVRSALLDEFPEINSISVKKEKYKILNINISEKDSKIIWCRSSNDCYYIDSSATAFSNANSQLLTNEKPLKIIEQPIIEEELGDNNGNPIQEKKSGVAPEKDSNIAYTEEQGDIEGIGNNKENTILAPIKIGDKVSDEDFIGFVIKLNDEITNKTGLKIKFYKTKGTKTREVIAFTDKNVRLYFNTTGDPSSQVYYLSEILSNSIEKGKESELKYIYLESENRVYYKY